LFLQFFFISAIMLSTLRVASRSAASREANMRTVVTGARHASAWSNVPQGPPVSFELAIATMAA
jgi:hypothetical protein